MKYYLLIFHLILCNTLKVDPSEYTYEPNSNRNLVSNNDDSKKNLIIAVISNCDWNNMAIFFKSYEKAHFENTDLIIFANKLKGKAKEKMKSYATEIYPIPDEYTKISTENSRWKIYSDFLNKNKNLYNQVFTTDIKTTFFQKDIFKYYDNKKSFLGISLEDGFISLDENTKKIIIDSYGEEIFKTMKKKRIINVSTILGTINKFIELSNLMWDKINSELSKGNEINSKAVINYIIYHDKILSDSIIFSDNRDGPIMSLGLANRALIILDENKNVLNIEGQIAHVVNQYDKQDDIFDIAINKYCPGLYTLRGNPFENYIFVVILFVGTIAFSFLLGSLYIYRFQDIIRENNKNNKCK